MKAVKTKLAVFFLLVGSAVSVWTWLCLFSDAALATEGGARYHDFLLTSLISILVGLVLGSLAFQSSSNLVLKIWAGALVFLTVLTFPSLIHDYLASGTEMLPKS